MNDEQANNDVEVAKTSSEVHVGQSADEVLSDSSYNRSDYETGAVDEATLAEQSQPRLNDPAAEAEAEANPS